MPKKQPLYPHVPKGKSTLPSTSSEETGPFFPKPKVFHSNEDYLREAAWEVDFVAGQLEKKQYELKMLAKDIKTLAQEYESNPVKVMSAIRERYIASVQGPTGTLSHAMQRLSVAALYLKEVLVRGI